MLEQQWAIVFGALIVLGGTASILLVMLNNTYSRIEDAIKLGTSHESRIRLLEDQMASIRIQFKEDILELDKNLDGLHSKVDNAIYKITQVAAVCNKLVEK